MKNSSSLYILKPIFTILIGLILVLSCSQEETNPDMPAEVPDANAAEVVVNLLIKGEAILPPTTKQMSQETEGSYQDGLQLLILEKQQDNTYIYNCHRPVEGSQGNFTVKVPNTLDGKELKFLLFSNSKDIIGDPDQKFVVVDGTNKNEEEIRQALLLTVNTKWDPSKKIPMWAEDAFTFRVPAAGTPATPVATLKLMRMLARVDVGLNYNGKELNSTAQALSNFKLQKIKVHHSKDKGQLMPDTSAYETTGAGADKVITIKTPSIPADGQIIPPYEITVPDGSHACERDIYLFEQDMNLSQTDFDVNRTCILVQGEYTAPAPAAGGTGTTYTGWYRLDFRDFGDTEGYADILRNKLYRFNITAVKGSGFATESDALSSVSSNITVELLAMDLNQNNIIFDGQSFLAVSGSELYFYRDLNTTDFSLTTNYGNGWKIETGDGITAIPAAGTAGSSVVKLTWETLPGTDEDKEILLIAGNLKKKMLLRYVHEDAPGNLTSFSLNPPFLYFAKDGGTGKINIVSNIIKKYLSATVGKLNFTVLPETESDSFDVTVNPFAGTSEQRVEQGVVNVHVKAANADVKGQSLINQLTYDKQLECTPAVMGHGVVNNSSSSVSMNVSYTTAEVPGTYLIEFVPENGNGTALGPQPSNPANGTGTVAITATPNKTSAERTVGKLRFMAAEDGKEISLIGYTLKEFTIRQEPVPAPVVRITPASNSTTLEWNQKQHGFTVAVDNPAFVENNNVAIRLLSKNRTIDMNVPATGELEQPVNITMAPNRGDFPKTRTVGVSVDGHGDHVGTGQITFTQQAPDRPANEPSGGGEGTLAWNSEGAILTLSNLNNIYEVTTRIEAVDNFTYLEPTVEGKFEISGNKAVLDFVCATNPGTTERKAKITAMAIGNRESDTYRREFFITQGVAKLGTIAFTEISKTVGYAASAGQVAVVTSGIDPGSIKILKSADWVTATLNAGKTAVQYSVEANPVTNNRVATITLVAKDSAGRDMMTIPDLTITQSALPKGSITLSMPSITIPSVRGQVVEVPYTQVNIPNGVRHELKYNVQQAGQGHFIVNVTNNMISCSVKNTNGYAFDLFATLTLSGYDALGVQQTAVLSITHLRSGAGYFEIPVFQNTLPSNGYNGVINLDHVNNMQPGKYVATTLADATLPGWLTFTNPSGHALNVRIGANTGKRRTAEVKVTGTDLDGGKVSQTLEVVQAGGTGGIQVTPASHKFGAGKETKDFAVTLTNIDMSKPIAIGKPDWIESASLIDNNTKLRVVKRQNPGGNTGSDQGSITLSGTDNNNSASRGSVSVSRKGNLVVVGTKGYNHTGLMDASRQTPEFFVNGESRDVKTVTLLGQDGSGLIENVGILRTSGRLIQLLYSLPSNKERYGEIKKTLTIHWTNEEGEATQSLIHISQKGYPDAYGFFNIPENNRHINSGQTVRFDKPGRTHNLKPGTKVTARIRKSGQIGTAHIASQAINANESDIFGFEITASSASYWSGVVEIVGIGVDGQVKVLYNVNFLTP